MEETITFVAYGKQYTEKAIRISETFYKVMSGYYFACWVHVSNVIVPNHKEANEVSNEDLQAAAEYFDKLKKERS